MTPLAPRRAPESGLTLTEITIVFVLASLVMTGLLAFYLNSQAVWVDGSSQVITQREATLVLTAITARARRAKKATLSNNPDAKHMQIALEMPGGNSDSTYFYWVGNDSLMHEGHRNVGEDRGAMVTAVIECFTAHADSYLVYVDSLRVKSPAGSMMSVSTAAAFQNRGSP